MHIISTHETDAAVEKQYIVYTHARTYVCVCMALVTQQWMCMNHIVICVLSPIHSICPHYLTNGMIKKKKKLLDIKFDLIFSTTFISNISHSKKKWARWNQNCALVFM